MRLFSALLLLFALSSLARADVVIGVAGPMSGAFASVGEEIRIGVETAAEALNRAGGIGGEPVTVVALDDKCEATTAEAVANQLVGRGAVLVVGHACTAAALPAARVYDANGIVFLSPAATNPRLTDERVGPAVFRIAPRSDGQAVALADHLIAAYAGRRVAFVHDGTVYGQGLVDAVRQRFEAAGGTVAMVEPFVPGEKSQNALVGKIQDAAVSAVVAGALQADAAVILGEMRARGLDAALIGNEALALEEFRDLAGPAADGVVFALPRDYREEPEARDLVARLAAEGRPTAGAVLPAHAAVEAYAEAVAVAGSRDVLAVSAALAAGPVATVIGPVAFDDKGDLVGADWRLYRWQDGASAPLPR